MTNNTLNIEVIFIGGGVGTGQHIFGVKDIQTFILHCAHIEEIHRDDHIDVEVILQAEAFFIPFHGVFQRGHRPRRTIKVAAIDVQLQRHFATRTRGEGVAQHVEVACHQRKQVARFRERVLPLYPMTSVFQFALRNAVTVGKQEGIFGFIGNNFGGKTRQYVRAVKIIRNMAETFGFTLSAKRIA